jgi:ribose transport system ATP-binding protein
MIFPKLGLARQPLFTPRKKYGEECEAAIKRLSIKAHNLDTPVRTLSGGNQQKIVVARWLSFNAKVLLLADPAKGVDVGAKRDLYRSIADQVREKRVSVILYASDIEELVECCDRLLVMYEGQVIATLEGDDINEQKIISTSMRVG